MVVAAQLLRFNTFINITIWPFHPIVATRQLIRIPLKKLCCTTGTVSIPGGTRVLFSSLSRPETWPLSCRAHVWQSSQQQQHRHDGGSPNRACFILCTIVIITRINIIPQKMTLKTIDSTSSTCNPGDGDGVASKPDQSNSKPDILNQTTRTHIYFTYVFGTYLK